MFREFLLTEKFVNLFDDKTKQKYAEEVYQLLQKAYSQIGGMKGSGFETPESMIHSIPFWKLGFSNGRLVLVIMYKDKNGRKLVAVGTDGSKEGKAYLNSALKVEFSRSYAEISGPLLTYLQKKFPNIVAAYRIPVEQVRKIFPDIRQIDDFSYERNIGGQWIEKIMLGTIGRTIST